MTKQHKALTVEQRKQYQLDPALRYAVLGLGKTGLSALQWLNSQGCTQIIGIDTRSTPPYVDKIKAYLPNHAVYLADDIEAVDIEKIDIIIASPGVALEETPIAELIGDKPVWGDVELFGRYLLTQKSAPQCIGITGSNGKSTVTKMLAHLLSQAGYKVQMAGNIGTPVLELLVRSADGESAVNAIDMDFVVLELSSFQLETTHSLTLQTATLLNISADHLDRHKTLAAYANAKQRIFTNAASAVVNRDDVQSVLLTPGGLPVLDFSLENPNAIYSYDDQSHELLRYDEALLSADALPIEGMHNIANALAALALTESLDIDPKQLASGLSSYESLPHRMAVVGQYNQIKWVNDSKSTNVASTLAAITSYESNVHLILGGVGKDQDFSSLASDEVVRRCKHIYLIGEAAAELSGLLSDKTQKLGVELSMPTSFDALMQALFEQASHGDTVLFSPACASFDWFTNFEHRGERFESAVRAEYANQSDRSSSVYHSSHGGKVIS